MGRKHRGWGFILLFYITCNEIARKYGLRWQNQVNGKCVTGIARPHEYTFAVGLASTIFWQVGSSATHGITSLFKETVMAMQSIIFNTGVKNDGRAIACIGGVIMAGNTFIKQ